MNSPVLPGVAIDGDDTPDTERAPCPWKPCSKCGWRGTEAKDPRTWPRGVAWPTCSLCHGLGLTLTSDWLASEWTILFLLPDESLGPRTPDDFLRLLLDGSYPLGGYRVMPTAHPLYAAAVRFAHDDMARTKLSHAVLDAKKGIFRLAGLTRHLRAVLIERDPVRKNSPIQSNTVTRSE
jgi:hypothetical protein